MSQRQEHRWSCSAQPGRVLKHSAVALVAHPAALPGAGSDPAPPPRQPSPFILPLSPNSFLLCPPSPPFTCQHHPVRPERGARRNHPLCPCTEHRGLPGLRKQCIPQPSCSTRSWHSHPVPDGHPVPPDTPHGRARPHQAASGAGAARRRSRRQAAPRPSRITLRARPGCCRLQPQRP